MQGDLASPCAAPPLGRVLRLYGHGPSPGSPRCAPERDPLARHPLLRFRCRCPGAVREKRQGRPAVASAARPLESALWGGLKDRARPAARVLDPTPPCFRVLRCALHGPFARLPPLLFPVAWLPGPCGSQRLLLFPLAARLGELVDRILFERQPAQAPLPLDPEILEMLPS